MTQAAKLAALGSAGVATGFKNRIINGGMTIDQRNAGASVTVTNTVSTTYTVDRWGAYGTQASKFSVQQNAGAVTPPSGFKNYLGVTSLSAYSVGTNDYFFLTQPIEGYNIADLGFGASGAATITVSFWVRSSLTGTFGGAIVNSAYNRSYPFSYTISSANTWEQKSITIAGDTSGTWESTSSAGLRLQIGLGSGATKSGTAGSWAAAEYATCTGATSVVSTNGATFYITGVQLEVGTTATTFDFRSYGTELALCQRYFEKSYNIDVVPGTAANYLGIANNNGTSDGGANSSVTVLFKVPKRTNATMTYYNADSGASGTWTYSRSGASGTFTTGSDQPANNGVIAYGAIGASWVASRVYGHWTSSAEL